MDDVFFFKPIPFSRVPWIGCIPVETKPLHVVCDLLLVPWLLWARAYDQ